MNLLLILRELDLSFGEGSVKADQHPAMWAKENCISTGSWLKRSSFPQTLRRDRHELFWKYQLPNQKHTVRIKLLNPEKENPVHIEDVLVYSNKPNASKL